MSNKMFFKLRSKFESKIIVFQNFIYMLSFHSYFSFSESYIAQYGNNTVVFKAKTTKTIKIPTTFTLGLISMNSDDYSRCVIFHNPALFTTIHGPLDVLYKNLASIEISTNYDTTLEFTVLCIKNDQCDYVNVFLNTLGVRNTINSDKDKQNCLLYVSSKPVKYIVNATKVGNSYYYNKSMATEFQNQIPTTNLTITAQYFIVHSETDSSTIKTYIIAEDFTDGQPVDPFYVGGVFHFKDSENNHGSQSILPTTFYPGPPISSKSTVPVGRFIIQVPKSESLTLDVPKDHLIVPINNNDYFTFEYGKSGKSSGDKGSVARFNKDGWVKFTNTMSPTQYLAVVSYKLENKSDCTNKQSQILIGSADNYYDTYTTSGSFYEGMNCYFAAFGTNLGFSYADFAGLRSSTIRINSANTSRDTYFETLNYEPYFIRLNYKEKIGTLSGVYIRTTIPKSQKEGQETIDYKSEDFIQIGSSTSTGTVVAIVVIVIVIIIAIVLIVVCCCFCCCRSRSSSLSSSSSSSSRRRNYAQPGYPAAYSPPAPPPNNGYQVQYSVQQPNQGVSQPQPQYYQPVQSPYTPAPNPYAPENTYPET